MTQLERFCSCIKSVKSKTLKRRPGQKRGSEGPAIAICVKSVLQTKGRTLKRFKCRTTSKQKAFLKTQKI